jgi:hypothetical protein
VVSTQQATVILEFQECIPSPNKSLQRSVNHKVLGRGREVPAPWRALSARVLTCQPAAAELSRWAT